MITPESEPNKEQDVPLSYNLPALKLGSSRFIDDLSESLMIHPSSAKLALKVLRSGMAELIVASGHLALSGLGTFDLRLRREHQRVNLRTHEEMTIATKVAVHFTPGTKLNDEVFSNPEDGDTKRKASSYHPPYILFRDPDRALNQIVLDRAESRAKASRQTLIDLMAVKGVVSLAAAHSIYRAFADSLSSQLSELAALAPTPTGRRPSVRVQGIGVFHLVERAERCWTNPSTGAQVNLPLKRAVTFKAAKDLEQSAQTKLGTMMQREME